MTKDDFMNLKVGTVVKITKSGVNYGKLGTAKEIVSDLKDQKRLPLLARGERVYLEPINCIFEFSDKDKSQGHQNKDGFYAFKPRFISII